MSQRTKLIVALWLCVWPIVSLIAEEVTDEPSHFRAVRLECKVTSVEEVFLCAGQVALVRRRSGSNEDLVVLAPDHERCWLVLAEVSLPLWIERA